MRAVGLMEPWYPSDGQGNLADPVALADGPMLPLGSRYHHPQITLIPGGDFPRGRRAFFCPR